MIYITRKEHFSSAHKLHNPSLSDERNLEIYGKCNHFHGHNYHIEVTLKGEPDKDSGYVMDLKKLKKILHEFIIDKVDHKYLNEVEMFKNIVPTTENMALIFWELIKDRVKSHSAELHSIRIYETEKNYVEYKGGV
jgi:6-pyruvoyltetrahydropterin/6-carboxytetrahydropterin synthase